jgi:uncharacterized protein YneF (UPF0154 family)
MNINYLKIVKVTLIVLSYIFIIIKGFYFLEKDNKNYIKVIKI